MSRWTREATERGARDGATAFAAKNANPPEPPYRWAPRRRAYLKAWEAAWWAAGSTHLKGILDRTTENMRLIRQRAQRETLRNADLLPDTGPWSPPGLVVSRRHYDLAKAAGATPEELSHLIVPRRGMKPTFMAFDEPTPEEGDDGA